MTHVKLTYFKPSTGKYYGESFIEVPRGMPSMLGSVVSSAIKSRTLPGLVTGHSPFDVLVHTEPPRLITFDHLETEQ